MDIAGACFPLSIKKNPVSPGSAESLSNSKSKHKVSVRWPATPPNIAVCTLLKITVNLSLGDVKLFGQLRNGRASGKPTGHEIDARGLAIGFRFSALAAGHAQRLN